MQGSRVGSNSTAVGAHDNMCDTYPEVQAGQGLTQILDLRMTCTRPVLVVPRTCRVPYLHRPALPIANPIAWVAKYR